MTRAHFYTVAQDVGGNAIENAVVRVLQPGTTNPISVPIYSDDTTVSAMSNPFTTISGVISFYIDSPQRVRLGITPPSSAEALIEDIDVGGVSGGGTSDHVGAGTGSTKVGLDAVSAGTDSVALGQAATSGGSGATALGRLAASAGLNATGVGSQAVASGERAVVIGRTALGSALDTTAVGSGAAASNTRATSIGDTSTANSVRATALGANATAGHDHASAVGSEATTTEANQVMLGNGLDFAESPGGFVLVASDGKRGRLRMLPDGTLATIWHVATSAVNLLPATEQTFESGLGSWASVSGLTSTTQSTDYALAGTNSMKLILSGAAAASARSSKVAAVVGTVYVGQARMFYHAGAATAGLNGTAWLEFYDGSNVIIGTATVGRTRAFFPDTWVYVDARAVAPALTATVALRVGLPTGGGASADAFYADAAGVFAVPGTV